MNTSGPSRLPISGPHNDIYMIMSEQSHGVNLSYQHPTEETDDGSLRTTIEYPLVNRSADLTIQFDPENDIASIWIQKLNSNERRRTFHPQVSGSSIIIASGLSVTFDQYSPPGPLQVWTADMRCTFSIGVREIYYKSEGFSQLTMQPSFDCSGQSMNETWKLNGDPTATNAPRVTFATAFIPQNSPMPENRLGPIIPLQIEKGYSLKWPGFFSQGPK